jgi:hypothetical protein
MNTTDATDVYGSLRQLHTPSTFHYLDRRVTWSAWARLNVGATVDFESDVMEAEETAGWVHPLWVE